MEGTNYSTHFAIEKVEFKVSDLPRHQLVSGGVKFQVQFSSVAQSCPTLCDPMNRSTPGLPLHHQLPEFTQTHVHRVGDAIQPSHPLPSTSPPAPNPSQHQSLSLDIKIADKKLLAVSKCKKKKKKI